MIPPTATPAGLHEFVATHVLARYARPGFARQTLALAPGHLVFPPNGYQLSRKTVARTFRLAAVVFSGDAILGDHHVFVLEIAT